jgi:hypothetical protein
MPPESAVRLAEFARSGGRVIVIGDLPREAPGLKDERSRSAQVRGAFQSIEAGALASVPDAPAALRTLLDTLAPDFEIVTAGKQAALADAVEHVGFSHRRLGETDLYFVANISDGARDLRARFDAGHRAPQRWNPETGAVEGEPPYEFPRRRDGRAVTEVELRLDPFESCFVVFGSSSVPPIVAATDPRARWTVAAGGPGTRHGRARVTGAVSEPGVYEIRTAAGRIRRVAVGELPAPIAIEGPWLLTLGSRGALTVDRLRPWAELEGGKGFSGWGTYQTDIVVPAFGRDVDWIIELGRVHETAEVTLNGHELGAAWRGVRRLRCRDAVRSGPNRLRIEVANLWIHHVLAHPPGDPSLHLRGVGPYSALAETAGIRWGTYGEVPPERVPESGLLGPVRLVAVRRVELAL